MSAHTSQSFERDPRETIASVLRQVGFTVIVSPACLDDGFPQLLIGAEGRSVLAFVKGKHQCLTAEEREFQRTWRGGPILTLRSVERALDDVGFWFSAGRRRRA